jgi:hypothetical protein
LWHAVPAHGSAGLPANFDADALAFGSAGLLRAARRTRRASCRRFSPEASRPHQRKMMHRAIKIFERELKTENEM